MRSEVPLQPCVAPVHLVAMAAVPFKVIVVGVLAPTIAAGILRGMRGISSVLNVLLNRGKVDVAVRAKAVACLCPVIAYNVQTSKSLAAKAALWMLASFVTLTFPFGRKGELTEPTCPLSIRRGC